MKKFFLIFVSAFVFALIFGIPALAQDNSQNKPAEMPPQGQAGVQHAYNSLIWPGCWGIGNGYRTSQTNSKGKTEGRYYGNILGLIRLDEILDD